MTQNSQHQTHLESAIEQQRQLLNDVQELNNQVSTKRELVLKVQGVIEYLQQIESATQMDVEKPVEEPVQETKKSKS